MENINRLFDDKIIELEILKYKSFFKNHCLNLKNIELTANEADRLRSEMLKSKPKHFFTKDYGHDKLVAEVGSFLTFHFTSDVLNIYNREIPIKNEKKTTNEDHSGLTQLISEISNTVNQMHEKDLMEWEHKIKFLYFIHTCLVNYGLSPNILKRNPVSKRFNVKIVHYYNSKIKRRNIKTLIPYDILKREILNQYVAQGHIKIEGKLIPFDKIDSIKITSTLLEDDEIELFALKNSFSWNTKDKNALKFIDSCLDETDVYLPNPFLITSPVSGNIMLIDEVKHILKNNLKALKLYE